jgi:2,4-dienoyl-CoA reductase-like NADH-dependent reductase (Old Yellow Enzyme family)
MDVHIGSELKLPCGLTLPNRLCKAAMTEAMADHLNRPTPELCRLYERWSQGGTGLLITGNIMVDSRYLERPGNVCIDGPQDAQQLGMLTALANAGRAKGSRIIAQLGHAGRQSHAWINLEPVGPGDVSLENPHGLPSLLAKGFFGKPRALSAPEVEEVVQRFGHAASVCQQCKFDGVQIHAAHGYLLSSFLNPRANNRDTLFGDADEYGGALEKRARALLDVVRAVRRSVGAPRADFLVSVKLNSADFQAGGFSAEEAVRVATWLEAEGIDLLEISGGNYESGIYFEGASSTPDGADGAPVKTPAPAAREAYFLRYGAQLTCFTSAKEQELTLTRLFFCVPAANVQRTLRHTPVMVTGGWRSRAAMDAALASSNVAMIGLGAQFCRVTGTKVQVHTDAASSVRTPALPSPRLQPQT